MVEPLFNLLGLLLKSPFLKFFNIIIPSDIGTGFLKGPLLMTSAVLRLSFLAGAGASSI